MIPKMHLYYDAEGDYLELRFGDPTESYYEKLAPDTYVRLDKKTKEKKGYAIFNVQKSASPIKTIDFDIPLGILKMLKNRMNTDTTN